jgi:hypothetical protein
MVIFSTNKLIRRLKKFMAYLQCAYLTTFEHSHGRETHGQRVKRVQGSMGQNLFPFSDHGMFGLIEKPVKWPSTWTIPMATNP